MTFTKTIEKGRFSYLLLDDFVDHLELFSEVELTPKEVDNLTARVLEIGSKEGIMKTVRGEIRFILINKSWEDITNTNEQQND